MDAAPTLQTQSVLHMAQMAQMVEQALRLTGHVRSRVQIPLREFFYEKKNLPGGEVLPSNIKSSDEWYSDLPPTKQPQHTPKPFTPHAPTELPQSTDKICNTHNVGAEPN